MSWCSTPGPRWWPQPSHWAREAASSVRDVADRAETVLASLPSPQASRDVATGADGVDRHPGPAVRRSLDRRKPSRATHSRRTCATRVSPRWTARSAAGSAGAENGTLAVMVSGARAEFDVVEPVSQAIGRPILVSEKPGAAQTMKLVNNLLAATALAATSEVMVMGVKAGLDAQVMIDVLNAGSGGTNASRDKFPRSCFPVPSTTASPRG